MILFHNASCSTSRTAKQLLEKENCRFEVRDYLNEPPTQKELKELLQKLGLKAIDIVRKKEALYQEQYSEVKLTNAEWIRVLSKNPRLIERPILITGSKAVIGRPPERVLDLVKR